LKNFTNSFKNKIFKIYFFCIIILLILSENYFPQLLPLKIYTTENNIPNSSITTITQDISGRLWLGPLDGISIYDGIEFQNLSIKDGLIDRVILSIFANEDTSVWIGTYAGLSKYKNGKIQNFTTDNGLIENEIWTIAKGFNNDIWFGTLSKGISIYSNGTSQLYRKG
jgi:ligand-binding sensor domain-containing protein